MDMNAVGTDVPKGKSMIAILQPYEEVVSSPSEVKHASNNTQSLIEQIRSIEDESRIVMEHIGRCYEPLARELSLVSPFVTAVNPKFARGSEAHSLRRVKSDKANAVKVARYTLDSWMELKQYSLMDELRSQLKATNRQFGFYMKHKTAVKNSLISILDQTYPGVNTYFDNPTRENGSQKWVDFAIAYWYVDYARELSLNAFVDHYQKWCEHRKYNFGKNKAEEVYEAVKGLVPVLLKDDLIKLIAEQSIERLNTASKAVEELHTLMNGTATKLPEYPVAMDMRGVGPSLGPQLMAEIGDAAHFTHKGAVAALAGAGPGVNRSGTYEQKSVLVFKRGSSSLRKTLLQVVDCLIETEPQGDPVYAFIDKRRAQGKPYYTHMIAGTNKFLRIYYGKVREYLMPLPKQRVPHPFRPAGNDGLFVEVRQRYFFCRGCCLTSS